MKPFTATSSTETYGNIELETGTMLLRLQALHVMAGVAQRQRDLATPRYANHPLRLVNFGYQAYSQNDEDGIIQEIYGRIGVETHTFVEIGVDTGNECNTANLLVSGWSGTWIEGNPLAVKAIQRDIMPWAGKDLTVFNATAKVPNVNKLVGTDPIDLLSIDIDHNDYWIWKAIDAKPRVVVIEYNGTWRPPLSVTVPYDEKGWDGTNHAGASLEALARLGAEKGYSLVGCNYTGINAFFVRDDLVKDLFLGPFTAEEHYEPMRFLFWERQGFSHSKLGELVSV